VETVEDRLNGLGTTEVHRPVRNVALKYPSRFGLLTWPEIDFQVTGEMLVKGILPTQGFSVIYGESGSGKTHLSTDLALHVARGVPWFGRKVIPGGVIYIAAEGGLSMQRRVVGHRQHYKLTLEQDIPFALIPSPIDLLDPDADLAELLTLIKAVATDMSSPLRLIIVDTLSRALAGGNENAPDHMGQFVRNIDRIREETGAHISVVHHAGKNPSQGARGHSLLRAAADTEIEVTKAEGASHSTVRVTKQRDGSDGDAFAFDLRVVELGQDEDGGAITTCVVVPLDGDASQPRARKRTLTAEYLKALDYLADVLADHSEFVTAAGIPTDTPVVHVDRWREHLKHRGLHDGTENGKKWFQRVRNALIAANRIVIDGPYVWIVKP
jgi:KaiC/GvpD/RAD55 family RecA-like ATPase